ncbi:hypothetical protein [Nocardia vaccinii]|uniref:hypothetical protein n=1 Tax=Nocardia vaccinii TaxID=1822 RepID=UPI000833A926|nr:hypothetical protein [Nocardia vaccinii]
MTAVDVRLRVDDGYLPWSAADSRRRIRHRGCRARGGRQRLLCFSGDTAAIGGWAHSAQRVVHDPIGALVACFEAAHSVAS